MKTKHSAGWIVRIRVFSLCLALVTIAGIEFGVSESLAARIGQTTARQNEGPQAPNVDISDLFAAAR